MDAFGSLARLYDGEYRLFTADVDLYLTRLATARVRGPVLELACGSGRVAVPLAAAGYRVTGLDLSPVMLGRARRRRRSLPPETALRLRFSRQDMRDFHFPRRFGAALIPFSGLALLPEPSDRAACLMRLAHHLEPGALLIVDLPAPAATPAPGRRTTTSSFVLSPSYHLVTKTADETADPARPVTRVRYSYQVRRFADDRLVEARVAEFDLARVARGEIEGMLYDAGFDVVDALGDYRGHPFGPRSPRLILQAVRLP